VKGRKLLRFAGVPFDLEPSEHDVLVPICHLRSYNLPEIQKHLLSLNARDRYLRFGYAATDEHITQYVQSLNFEHDEIYGIFNRDLHLLAMAHLAIYEQANSGENKQISAEFGVSVHGSARGRGYGHQLFKRALMHARNANASTILIHALSENAPMLKIARKAGATLERDGGETQALLKVPKGNLKTRMKPKRNNRRKLQKQTKTHSQKQPKVGSNHLSSSDVAHSKSAIINLLSQYNWCAMSLLGRLLDVG